MSATNPGTQLAQDGQSYQTIGAHGQETATLQYQSAAGPLADLGEILSYSSSTNS